MAIRTPILRRRELLGLCAGALAQQRPEAEPPEAPVDWVCPMDADVRAKTAGRCPRCGMKLVAGIPNPVEYPLRLTVSPRAWRPGQEVRLRFEVLHPQTGKRVQDLQLIHERLLHLFLISQDLEYFAHEHPELQPDGTFLFVTRFPKPGMYRLLGDFYPEGGTPQLAVKTLLSAGAQIDGAVPNPAVSLAARQTENLNVKLRLEPEAPIAGLKTMLFFELSPASQLEQYLGAWGHLLVGSADLIDLVHTHPFLASGGPELQFNVVFPRPGKYRLWAQFQSAGVVNTAVFTVQAKGLS